MHFRVRNSLKSDPRRTSASGTLLRAFVPICTPGTRLRELLPAVRADDPRKELPGSQLRIPEALRERTKSEVAVRNEIGVIQERNRRPERDENDRRAKSPFGSLLSRFRRRTC